MPKFTDLLLTADFIKSAGPENPSTRQLEADFGRVAYTFLTDRAPQLINYLLGFETVEQDADGARAVGIFGFKLGDTYYYVPVFFINNQIKGMDLLFNKTNNTFIPLQEDWVTHIVNSQPVELGSGASNNRDLRTDLAAPDFGFLRDAPGVKAACVIEDGFNTWNHLQGKIAESFNTDAEFQNSFACAIARMQNKRELPLLKDAASKLIPYLEDTGGPKAVRSVVSALNDYKYANAAATFYNLDDLVVTNFNEQLTPKVAEAKLTITTSSYGCASDEDNKRIVRYGFTIKDLRDDKEKSSVLPTDYPKRFAAPDEPGLYNVLLSNGGTVEAWVLMPYQPHSNYMIVVEPTSGSVLTTAPASLIVRDDKIDKDKTIYNEAIKLEDMRVGRKYIILNDALKSSAIFSVRSVSASSKTRTELRGYFSECAEFGPQTYNSFDRDTGAAVEAIQLSDFDSDRLRVSGDKLIVPKNWKAYEIEDTDNYELRGVLKPGNLNDLDESLFKNALHKLVVESPDRGLDYYIRLNDFNEGPYTLKQAAWRLTRGLGIDSDETFNLLKEADANIKARRLIKIAQGVGVAMPTPAMSQSGVDPYTGAMLTQPDVQQLQGQMTGVPPTQDPMQQGINMGGQTEADMANSGMQTEVMTLADQAARTGQKNVFDQSTIAGLANVYDISSIVDMYLPDMFKSLDRLGRILFLFYWKNEEFAERYGITDLTAMEDDLRSVFKNYGALILQLKAKSVDSNLAPA